MLDVTISILALIAGGVTMELFAAIGAPVHPGTESATIAEDSQVSNPS
jgi:hypothetical protein